ncbi:MAG TPA: FtsX-like permease family protein [Tepidiformaceae bacterium]|nr:FtsX-like permease family protein [Tepidiformaceae bacterium]
MNELFGIPTVTIMATLVALLGVALATVAAIGVGNRTMFRMAMRNIPRRGLQTVLVVSGLSLATLITTASFVTGDTIDHSLTRDTYRLLGRSDIDITWNGEREFSSDGGAYGDGARAFVSDAVVPPLEAHFAADPDIETFLPFLNRPVAATDQRSQRSTPDVALTGVDAARMDRAGGLRLLSGGTALLGSLRPGEAYLSERAARDLRAEAGDTVTVFASGTTRDFRVAGIVEDELASGVLGLRYSRVPGGLVVPLDEARAVLGLKGNEIDALTVSLRGDARSTVGAGEAAADRIERYLTGEGAGLFAQTGGLESDRTVEVFPVKADLVAQAELYGNMFTTLFLVLGLFSMAAGVMLIFMIFVMLAAERKAEMGMARAVGAHRGHLVQSFIAEGVMYSLLAGAIGVALGAASAFGMTRGLLPLVGGEYFALIEFSMTPVSLVIGYSLGVVITFITVVFASLKVSHVNIVAAIRQLPEESRREARRKTRWAWVAAGVPALVVPPLGLWFIARKGFGLPWAWIIAPSGIALGALLILAGGAGEVLFPFALGMSIIPLSVAALARYHGVPNRPLWTVTGFLLGTYWLLPPGTHDRLFGEFTSDIEMFVLSGIMIVVSFTLVIVFNARLLTRMFSSQGGRMRYAPSAAVGFVAVAAGLAGAIIGERGDGLGQLAYLLAGVVGLAAVLAWSAVRFPALAPAMKMAIAYPLSNRFRTGMTIAMFSIIVFSLTVFSILLANFDSAFLGGDARGNLDIIATANAGEPMPDLAGVADGSGIAGRGAVTLPTGATFVRETTSGDAPMPYPVLGADDGFFSSLAPSLDAFATGYGTPAEVLAAVRDGANLALADNAVIGVNYSDRYEWTAEGVQVDDHRFAPFTLEVTNAATGEVRTVTVVGILKATLPTDYIGGIYLNGRDYAGFAGQPVYSRVYLRLHDAADDETVAADIESALATRGVQAESVTKILRDAGAQSLAFNRMFQAFMGLGLVVGIAGLGVIAFRSVVERRQQIGMLRAIGYQRTTVTLTFLLESSFVAAMGILSGIAGGAVLARNLLTSEAFTEGATIQFAVPWAELVAMAAIAMLFSLGMTWLPSRGASRVPVAEALRYE